METGAKLHRLSRYIIIKGILIKRTKNFRYFVTRATLASAFARNDAPHILVYESSWIYLHGITDTLCYHSLIVE